MWDEETRTQKCTCETRGSDTLHVIFTFTEASFASVENNYSWIK